MGWIHDGVSGGGLAWLTLHWPASAISENVKLMTVAADGLAACSLSITIRQTARLTVGLTH